VAAEDPNLLNPYMFTGRRFDFETGLYYYRARYYNPYIGRFLQTDPIGYDAGINWYLYCHNNPLSYTDPSGLDRINVAFYDPDEELIDRQGNIVTFEEAANDWTEHDYGGFTTRYYPMRCWRDVIDRLKALTDGGHIIIDVYFHDHAGWADKNNVERTLQFGNDVVPIDNHEFWNELKKYTLADDPSTDEYDGATIHFRHCNVAKNRSVLGKLAKLTGRRVTGVDGLVTDVGRERGKAKRLDIPDYTFGGDLIGAVYGLQHGNYTTTYETIWKEKSNDKQPY
jgi:RHS repeat-associated protein